MIPALLLVIAAVAYRVASGLLIHSGTTWLSNFAPFAALGKSCSEPYLVAGRSTIDRLQDKLEVEGKLQFADDNDRRVVTAQRDKVTAPDLPFDGEAKFFEITFDG